MGPCWSSSTATPSTRLPWKSLGGTSQWAPPPLLPLSLLSPLCPHSASFSHIVSLSLASHQSGGGQYGTTVHLCVPLPSHLLPCCLPACTTWWWTTTTSRRAWWGATVHLCVALPSLRVPLPSKPFPTACPACASLYNVVVDNDDITARLVGYLNQGGRGPHHLHPPQPRHRPAPLLPAERRRASPCSACCASTSRSPRPARR